MKHVHVPFGFSVEGSCSARYFFPRMMPTIYRWVLLGLLAAGLTTGCANATSDRAATAKSSAREIIPPPPKREFRGVWIATVDNIDWPSRKGLTVAEQKAELIALLDRATQLKLNAIVFQVRPQCDALYASALEPWSEFLTGQMGKAPETPFDPLAFVITESHRRGMELHAWFNPYRALHPANKGPVANNHISKTKPQLVRKVGRYLWLDPGEREVQDYSLAVVMDVVKRYNVDGVHFDDYFYPYPEKDANGQDLEFPDEASWQKFGVKSGLSRDDWRRENANQFIQRVHQAVKAEKPWVKFGISPFGIWRPGHPPQIEGFDQYGKLYADARKWLVNGWLDYFAPQLYWPIEQRAQSYPVLLNWWNQQNPKRLHIWPGLAVSKASGRDGWKPEEIVRQVQLAAQQPVSAGHIHFSMKHFGRNPALMTALQKGPYAEPALIPASPWLKCPAPQKPNLTLTAGTPLKLSWSAPGEPPQVWLLQLRQNGQWRTEIIAGKSRAATLRVDGVDVIALSAINRAGVASTPAVQTIPR
jgi:uncharacterized lipoprotein YddW (UPF0748 family)